MVGNVTVIGQFAGSCSKVLSHDVAVVCGIKLELVLGFLIITPGIFTITFSLSQALVLLLHSLHHGSLLGSCLVFKHSTHAGNGSSLFSVGLLFSTVHLGLGHVLALLLGNPFLLLLSLNSNSFVVAEILTFELAAA